MQHCSETIYLAANIRKSQGDSNEMTVDVMVAQRKLVNNVYFPSLCKNVNQ